MKSPSKTDTLPFLSPGMIEDLKLAASKRSGPERRAFQAEIALKYCKGNPRRAEAIFGWSRQAVGLGLHEMRTGIICVSAQAAFAGAKRWEDKHPDVATVLWSIVESYASNGKYLSAAEAAKQLQASGISEHLVPSTSSMANILMRNGYRSTSATRS